MTASSHMPAVSAFHICAYKCICLLKALMRYSLCSCCATLLLLLCCLHYCSLPELCAASACLCFGAWCALQQPRQELEWSPRAAPVRDYTKLLGPLEPKDLALRSLLRGWQPRLLVMQRQQLWRKMGLRRQQASEAVAEKVSGQGNAEAWDHSAGHTRVQGL